MKLGINSLFILKYDFAEGLRYARELGARCIEIGCMGEASKKYCDWEKLVADRGELRRWLDTLGEHELEISAFATHGDSLSPDPAVAAEWAQKFRTVCKLAELSGVEILTLNSSCPEGAEGDKTPCWITDVFNASTRNTLRWQWEERVIPFWREQAKIAGDCGCKLAFEPWIGDVVHTPVTLMKLRDAVGDIVGCNFDPSHLFVQQIDVLESIRYLGDLIWHTHMKDTRIDPHNLRLQGLLDTTVPPTDPKNRVWTFTCVGWGHDVAFWRDFFTNLRFVGYEGALSVEMESDYINLDDGMQKQFDLLRELTLAPAPVAGERWWEVAGLDAIGRDD